jgi:hypothetical protein
VVLHDTSWFCTIRHERTAKSRLVKRHTALRQSPTGSSRSRRRISDLCSRRSDLYIGSRQMLSVSSRTLRSSGTGLCRRFPPLPLPLPLPLRPLRRSPASPPEAAHSRSVGMSVRSGSRSGRKGTSGHPRGTHMSPHKCEVMI